MSICNKRAGEVRSRVITAKRCLAVVLASMSLVVLPVAAQIFSWDPLKDVQEALPEGTPSEAKIIQARQQVREMSQDGLATLAEIAPEARRAIDSAAGYAVFSTFGLILNCVQRYRSYPFEPGH